MLQMSLLVKIPGGEATKSGHMNSDDSAGPSRDGTSRPSVSIQMVEKSPMENDVVRFCSYYCSLEWVLQGFCVKAHPDRPR